MARPNKEGLDYFELDCHVDDKVRLIQAEYGLKGIAVVVLLLQQIYGERGYYMTWDVERSLLFASEIGSAGGDHNLILEIVSACIKRGIFSQELYQKYGILTSSGIQKRYFNATTRREIVRVRKEYLLVSVPKNVVYVDNNSINVDNNSINVDNNAQRREENIYIRPKKASDDASEASKKPSQKGQDVDQLRKDFEIIYDLYPKKVGKALAFSKYKTWVTTGKKYCGRNIKLTNRQIYLAVKRYKTEQEAAGHDDLQYWKNFDTLMGNSLLDYLPEEDEG